MGFFSTDMESLVEEYQREAIELMEEFNNCLTRFSRSGSIAQKDINSLFRIVHTIKSSSAMIGLQAMSTCTHRMEDLLLIFRDDTKRIDGNESRITDLLYTYGDYITAETSAMSEADFSPSATEPLLEAINNELNYFAGAESTAEHSAASVPELPKNPESEERDAATYKVIFRDECNMINVRAFQLVKQLRPHCTSLSSMPADFEKKSAAEQIAKNGLILTIVTEQIDEIKKLLAASPYIKEYLDIDTEEKAPSLPVNTPVEEDDTSGYTTKFVTVAWEKIQGMQNITGDLITAYTLLKSGMREKNIVKEAEDDLLALRKFLAVLEMLVDAVSMAPVSSIASPYYRLIRDMSKTEKKQVEFSIFGEELELDRNLLDLMSSPLIHLLRNAVDHGIESPAERLAAGKPANGKVSLSVAIFGGSARFIVADDGGGIDPEIILKKAKDLNLLVKPESEYSQSEIFKFIFSPGFTTNKTANQYSGRGVGMDVVQKSVDSLGGSVDVKSTVGVGTSFIIEVPVTMSSTECLSFSVGQYPCLVPARSVDKVCALHDVQDNLTILDGGLWLRDKTMIPVFDLFEMFSEPSSTECCIIVIHAAGQRAALLTGVISGEQTAVERPLPPMLASLYRKKFGVSGCSIIGSGKLALIINSELLLQNHHGEGTGHYE